MIKLEETIRYLTTKLKENDCIVLALSGGPDSMCLFSLLLQLKEKYHLKMICAHVNHNVRYESEEEARFVKSMVLKNECIFEFMKIENYPQENFESSARKKRYHFFNELIRKYQANYLMTAHHGDDLMETILMRLIRGSNLKGYAGFKKETIYKNYELLRPLIHTTKKEILEYNLQNNIEYRNDQSNEEKRYTRNRIRKNILPLLKNENRKVHRKFLKFSEELYSIENFLENMTKNALTQVYNSDKVNLQEFKKLDPLLKKRIIEWILMQTYQNEIDCITNKHLQNILDLCTSTKPNQWISLPKGKIARKNYNYLYIEEKNHSVPYHMILENSVKINEQEAILKVEECPIKKSNYILRINSKEIKLPLHIRNRKEKDKMEVKNLHGSKKVKDIFVNEKIPLNKRNTWPIVVDDEDTLLWIPGVKKSQFDKNIDEEYDIIYKYVISEEKLDEYDE